MKLLKPILIGSLLMTFAGKINCQVRDYRSLVGKNDSVPVKTRFYAGFIHQHENFFGKAFSFQGIEAGILNKKGIVIGINGSTFVSNLEAKINDVPIFVSISKAGTTVGAIRHNYNILHAGLLMNLEYFWLIGDESDFGLFKAENPAINFKGIVISPQIFAELNIVKWMKFRTGLGYNFYQYKDQSVVSKGDLNSLFFSFGFIFGKFN